uniref:C2H2-type domain-containing protein n=1 Tax=Meloidogyne incognita TaxID=6306 RepID=A0A914KPW7_MELIC
MKFIVPNTSAGMVIGKNGTSIKEIRETTTANIQIYPKAGTEEAKMSLERVITIGHETNDVLMSAMQKVLERVCADPLHSQPITSESQNVSSGYDFATSRVTTGASQFAGMQPTPAWQNQTSIEDEQNDRKKAVKMYCNRCGEFVMEFISEVDVTKDILDGIHVLMYHPFTSWNLSKTRFSKKYPFMDLKSRFNNFICSQCSSGYISLDELFEHSLTHLDQ